MQLLKNKRLNFSPRIVLTADETMMSKYRWGIFVGFSTCMPQGIIPDWFYFSVWAPPVPRKNGRALYADFGLRVMEAVLAEAFGADEVAVVHPRDLNRVVGERTEIIGISGHDFMGINPPTSEFVDMLDIGPPYNRVKFFELMRNPVMKENIVVIGGKAAWQLADEEVMDRLNIDYVHLGEGEITVPEMFRCILEGEKLPRIIKGKEPDTAEVPNILGATIHGLVEIGRGCGRGCAFCTPNMQRLRYQSIEHIARDVETNIRAGQTSICLHSEDVLRYGARGIPPNEDRVIALFRRVASIPGIGDIGTSHIALATVYHNPGLVREVAELCYSKIETMNWLGAQTGIETGSERLIAKHMRGKVLPSPPERWREVVLQAFGILDDNNWICAATMINGLPGETTDDVIKSIELVEDLKKTSTLSLVVPMNFVSMRGSVLDNEESFNMAKMTPEHWQLMGECVDHDLKVVPRLLRMYRKDRSIKSWLLSLAATRMSKMLQKYVDKMRRGEPPTDRHEISKWLNPDIPDLRGPI